MERFNTLVDEMVTRAGLGVVDYQSTIGNVLTGYAGGRVINAPEGPVEMSGSAAEQLFKLVGLTPKVINEFGGHPELQQAMVLAKLGDAGEKAKDEIVCRGRRVGSGTRLDAFLTEDYLPVSNSQILRALRNELPETVLVHRANIADRRMMLRLTDESWYHDIGHGRRALTALLVRNDEVGRGALSIRTGVTDVGCWNHTLAENPVFEHSHKFLLPAQVRQGIADAIGRLQEIAVVVAASLRAMHDVHVDDVRQMLKIMSGELGLPNYVETEAVSWWESNGAIPSLFFAQAAMTHGVQQMTEGKRALWDRREEVEVQTFNMATSFAKNGELKVCECPKCHRPLAEYMGDDSIEAEYTVGDDVVQH